MASFAIEVPGETAPLTQEALVQTLTAAASRTQAQIQAGTKQLQAWETKPGYHALLQDAFLHKPFPMELRMLALIQLKNGVDKYWRRTATNQMSQEERDKIRARLIDSIVLEETPQLASLEAVVAAKIARVDFPRNWPDLVSDLTNILRTALQPTASPIQLSRTLTLALHVIKEISSVRLARPKSALQKDAPLLFEVLAQSYQARTTHWEEFFINSTASDDNIIRTMDSSEQILKILRRLIMAGSPVPHLDSSIVAFWEFAATQTSRLVGLLGRVRGTPYFMLVGLHLTQLAKFHVSMADDHPTSFALFPSTPQMVLFYWSTAKPMRQQHYSAASDDDEEYGSVYESFCLRALLLLRRCFKIVYTSASSPKLPSATNNDQGKEAKERLKAEAIKDDAVFDVFSGLMHHFFVYGPSDLEEWQEAPEEWQFKEESNEDAYDTTVRSCAERLFTDVLVRYKQAVLSPLLQFCGRLPTLTHSLEKEAVLSAVGASASVLHDRFGYLAFLKDMIVPELQKEEQYSFVVRRRVAILLAQWANTEIEDESKSLTYQIYQHLLDPTVAANDLAVRITAGKRLVEVVNAWGFDRKRFGQFATTILTHLIALVGEADMPESKMAILSTLSSMIENMELEVGPFAEQIMSLLPPLWEQSGSEHIMKQAIVQILIKLVVSLQAHSAPLHSLVIPIIHGTLEPGSDTQLYLLGDAIELLLEVASQSTEANDALLSLVPLVLPVLEMENEVVEKALEIFNIFITLSPEFVLQDHIRQPFFESTKSLFTSKEMEIIGLTTQNTEMLIRSAGDLHGTAGVQAVASDLFQSGLLDCVLGSLMGNWSARQTTGPKKQDLSPDWRNETNYFCILSRLVLGDVDCFLAMLQAWAGSKSQEWTKVFAHLAEEWFGHLDSVGSPQQTKLMCLALTKLVESGDALILAKLQDLMSMWTSVVVELRTDDDDRASDCLVHKAQAPPEGEETIRSKVQRLYAASDPVFSVPLPGFVKHCLQTAIQKCGGQDVFQAEWLVNVDQDVVTEFGKLGIM